MNAAIIFLILTALMVTGMPVSIALGLTVLSFLFGFTDVPLESVALKLFTGIEKFEIMAIPFFILAGNFLTHGGVARRMINFATAMVGHWHGGLGLGGVVACALFAAVSGSSPATVVAIGSILLPAMAKAGFPKRFGAGVIATSGALGILIPPSIVMVMYAVATNTSVGALFMAGVVPGLLLVRYEAPTRPTSGVYEPCICLVAQGAKRVMLGDDEYVYDATHYLISSVGLPVVANVVEASPEVPLLGLALKLDMPMLAQMLVDSNLPVTRSVARAGNSGRGMRVSEVSMPLLNAFQRLLEIGRAHV